MASEPGSCLSYVGEVNPRRQVISVSKSVAQETKRPIRTHLEHVFGCTPRKTATWYNPQILSPKQRLKIERVLRRALRWGFWPEGAALSASPQRPLPKSRIAESYIMHVAGFPVVPRLSLLHAKVAVPRSVLLLPIVVLVRCKVRMKRVLTVLSLLGRDPCLMEAVTAMIRSGEMTAGPTEPARASKQDVITGPSGLTPLRESRVKLFRTGGVVCPDVIKADCTDLVIIGCLIEWVFLPGTLNSVQWVV